MATQQTSAAARVLAAPSVILLFLWMIVPLVMTLYFSSLRYSLLDAENIGFVGLENYAAFLTDPDFIASLINTLVLVVSVLVISVVGGILVALLMDQPVFGQNVLRLMVIAPFFVMPTVSALVWKNLLMNPDFGPLRLDRAVVRLRARSSGSPTIRCSRSSLSCRGSGCRSRASSC